jgi:hypothetical protein
MIDKRHLAAVIGLMCFVSLSSARPESTDQCDKKPPNMSMWRQCDAALDCAVIDGGCGWGTVNKKFVQEAEKYSSCIKPMLDCMGPTTQDKSEVKVDCIKNKCTILPTKR